MPRLIRVLLRWSATSLVLVLGLVSTAEAVVVVTTDPSVNRSAPAGNPGWNNVARLFDASAVYLGNGWMISANHVHDGAVEFSDGRSFSIVPGSDVQLQNPANIQAILTQQLPPDLKMFQLTANPGLPTLQITGNTPGGGSQVMMIGAGFDSSNTLIGWSVTQGTGTSLNWNPAPLPFSNLQGYSLLNSQHITWGLNTVESGGDNLVSTPTNSALTAAFATRFIAHGMPYSAQAVPGDSGGGVFQLIGNSWQLTGVMTEMVAQPNQPSGTAVFGDQTSVADLAQYKSQILSIMSAPQPAWQNLLNHFDVARTGTVTARDVLLVINALQNLPSSAHGVLQLTGTPGPNDLLLDVSGDGRVTSLDALELINALQTQSANSASAAAQTNISLVPEPSAGLLALSGFLIVALGHRLARARRKRAGC